VPTIGPLEILLILIYVLVTVAIIALPIVARCGSAAISSTGSSGA